MAYVRRARDIAQAFRNNGQLQRFILTDVTPTGRVLGTGSYGSVEEVTYQHLTCAGKKIHETLIDVENEGVATIVDKYREECQIMSSLHHPNITQFLGLCFLSGTRLPLLIMERLETSLDNLLEYVPNLPLSLKHSILKDVASGLLYLHERQPPVIHRDLTSKNVLLTSSLVAKITDMGNSRIADMRPGQVARTMSALPGTLVYMPPEALDDRHRYGTSLDIFSFGHLALFTITQTFPGDLLTYNFCDPDNPERLQARNEVERRKQYIQLLEAQVGSSHPALIQLVKQCLHNVPQQRPSTDELLTTLQRMRVEVEGEYERRVVKLELEKVQLAREMRMKNETIEELTQQQERHEAEMERTRDMKIELEELRADLQQRETRLREEQQSKEAEIGRLREELRKCQALLQEGARQVPLTFPLQLWWRHGPDMPFVMSEYIQSVMVQGIVYLGGGYAGVSTDNSTVMAYDTSSGKWDMLPSYIYRARNFAMTVINGELVLVGGRYPNYYSNVVGVWDRKKWTRPYPEMRTARSECSAVGHKEWLIVAGGVGDGEIRLSSVEVLNTGTQQWSVGLRTKEAWRSMKTAVVGDVCYFMGGFIKDDVRPTNIVYSVSLPALISQLDPKNPSQRDTQVWKQVSKLHLTWSTPLSISGSLLAVGGEDKDRKPVSGIHLYQPDTGEWVKVGDLLSPRQDCTCIMITDSKILIAGGWDGVRLKSVDIAIAVTN